MCCLFSPTINVSEQVKLNLYRPLFGRSKAIKLLKLVHFRATLLCKSSRSNYKQLKASCELKVDFLGLFVKIMVALT